MAGCADARREQAMSDLVDPRTHRWVQAALACGDLGVTAIDVASRLVTPDRRSREMLDLPADGETTIAACLAAVEVSDRQRVAEHLEAALRSDGDLYHDEFRTCSRRWITLDGRVQRDTSDRRVTLVVLLCDSTLRRTTDDATSRLVDDMARALRFNDMLVGVVAHDLRSPLAAIVASGQLLERTSRDPEVHAEVARIAASADRMSRIVEQLLDVTHARLDGRIPLRPRDVELAAIVREVVSEVEAAIAPARIHVERRADTRCRCDPDRVGQVLSNLLTNAVRHGTDPEAIRVIVDGTGSQVVSVTVTNPGTIPAESTPTLFNPFVRLRPDEPPRDRSRGLGLGLYIARRIALGHGGDIVVTSDDRRTTFRVDLPRVATSASFSLTPDRAEEEDALIRTLSDRESRVTAAMFGVLPVQERAPDAFSSLVERHARLLDLALQRQIYRDARSSLAAELRALADRLGNLGASANDVADLHSHALQRAIHGAPAVKVQALISEGRLVALELMGRLVTFYRKRSGFGSLGRPRPAETS
jgi:signal transduction histidine kinase